MALVSGYAPSCSLMARTIRIECPPVLQNIFCIAIREYVEAAYPPGCSECGQVARAALMDAAEKLESDFVANEGKYAELSRRLRSHFKAAFQYYAEQHKHDHETETLLNRLLEGEVIDEDALPSSLKL